MASEETLRLKILGFMAACPEAEFKTLWPIIQKDPFFGQAALSSCLRTFVFLAHEAAESGVTYTEMLERLSGGAAAKDVTLRPPPPPSPFETREVAVDPSIFMGCNTPGCDDAGCERTDVVPGGGATIFDVRVDKSLMMTAGEMPVMIVADARRTMKTLVDKDHPGYKVLRDQVGTSSRSNLAFTAYFRARLDGDGLVYIDVSRARKPTF